MRRQAHLALALLPIFGGCTSVEARRERDTQAVGSLFHDRTGLDLGPRAPDGGQIEPTVRELLRHPLTEEAALKIAILNNRAVRAALANLGVASADLLQAGLLSNPVFAANAKFFSSGTEIELGIVESFFDIFFLSARKRVAESQFEATKYRIVGELVRLTHDVRRGLVDMRAAERLLDVEREVLRAAQASVDLMTELHRAGNVTDPQLTAEELALARAKLAVARAEVASVEERESLNTLLGLWGETVSWTIDGELLDDPSAKLDLDRIETRAIAASLNLAEIRARATAQARLAGIVGWEAVLAPGEVGIAAKREADSSEWGVGPALGFGLPVFDTGAPRRAAAGAMLEELLANHISLAVEVRSAARRFRERAISLRDQARFIREDELPKAKRLVRETLRNYNAMQVGAFDVLLAKQQEIEAAQRYVETLRDAWVARLDLEELLAGSLNTERIKGVGERSSGHPTSTLTNERH
jgi:cobalt-zinc-cadmium efflux system outer membrane protein